MLIVYDMNQAEQWDRTVRSFCAYDVYYLSGYVRAFRLHGDGEPLLFYYEGEAKDGDAGVRGINVVMRRDIAQDRHFKGKMPEGSLFDLTTPYGYGGWLIEGAGERTDLFSAYEDWCRCHSVVSEFVRFHPVLKNHRDAEGAYEVVPLGATVAMDLTSPETIWAGLSSKNRNMIRKAEKSGVRIFSGRSEALYEQFRRIYNGTMENDNADGYYFFPPAFYDSICCDLPENAQVFYAQTEDGNVIAASIMMAANGRLNYHLSGSLREYRNLAPGNLLLYKAALWGCANGCRTFHLGGGLGSREDALFRFKRSFFRGELQRFHIGKKVFLPERYQQLLDMRGDGEPGDFFPRYRA